MRHLEFLVVCGLTGLAAACVNTERAQVVPTAESAEEPVSTAAPPQPALSRAIQRAIDHGWRDLYLMSECHQESGFLAIEIFGNGVGIWNKQKQLTLSDGELRSILEVFQAVEFAKMPEVFGRGTSTAPPKWQEALPSDPSGPRAATRIKCRVALRVDTEFKQVAQTTKGESSEPFQQLADRLFEICREPAKSGITAADLSDGLDKIASGELAPEVLQLTMNRKPDRDESEEGWLLRIRGPQAVTRSFVPRQGYGSPVRLRLDAEALSTLARLLADQDMADLPINLFAEHYTTVKLEVLNRKSQVEARRFGGMEPTQHGQQQERFDRVVSELGRLHRRVLAEGEPDSLPPTR